MLPYFIAIPIPEAIYHSMEVLSPCDWNGRIPFLSRANTLVLVTHIGRCAPYNIIWSSWFTDHVYPPSEIVGWWPNELNVLRRFEPTVDFAIARGMNQIHKRVRKQGCRKQGCEQAFVCEEIRNNGT